LTGSNRQSAYPTFERSNTLLEDIRRWIHDAGVDIAELLEPKECSSMVGIAEAVTGRLVDRHSA
jgi:hypothetical protein